ncbi:MAG: ferredoxin:protochlorophyllide reductase (ATP-dependent) subunit B, partial [Sphingobacteriaceae bacterium]
VNELQAADRTLEQVVRYYTNYSLSEAPTKTTYPSANILGVFTLGFHNQHDCRELTTMLNNLGIQVNQVIPEGGSVTSLKDLPKAWFNIVPYREVGLMAAHYLEKKFNQPFVNTTPMGVIDTATFLNQIAQILATFGEAYGSQENQGNSEIDSQGYPYAPEVHGVSLLPLAIDKAFTNKATKNSNYQKKISDYIDSQTRFVSQAAWFSRSIDCQNLTGKKVVVFGDATHAASMTKILAREMGIRVSCAGTYCGHDSDWFREQVTGFCDQILITDDHTQVGHMIARIEPAAIFGTQMERHIGKKLDIPCGVISAPVHIQNFPLGFRPFLGYEGTNQIADLVYNSFTLGMEDHLLEIFGGHDTTSDSSPSTTQEQGLKKEVQSSVLSKGSLLWTKEATAELQKIPGFVRGKVKRNTEKFAQENSFPEVSLAVMYKAKEAAAAGAR